MSPHVDDLPDWEDCPICGETIDECDCLWARQLYDKKNQNKNYRR